MTAQKYELNLKNKNLLRDGLLINGEWAKRKDTFEVFDPATKQVIATVPDGTDEDVDIAIEAAHKAFASFKHATSRQRSDWLKRWADLLRENVEDLSRIVTLENGKTYAEAKEEVEQSALTFDWFSGLCMYNSGATIPSEHPTKRIYTIYQPVGVCGLLTPWNFPASMIARKAGGAIAAGCTFVLKPAKFTPLTALAILYLGHEAGIPKGALNAVTTKSHTSAVGNKLTYDKRVMKISFTGSTKIGKILTGQASSTMKKVSMELGGNCPFVVFDDADVEVAVDSAMAIKFRGTGQVCISANRFFVQENIYDSFVEKLAARINKLKIGHGLDKDTTLGPLESENAVKKVHDHVTDAIEVGKGRLVTGGKSREDLGGYFYEPTLIVDVDPHKAKVFSEETFGPLAAVAKFKTEEEVTELANSTNMGLASYFFTENVSRATRFAEALESGMVGLNTGAIEEMTLPFGGIKQSGYGKEISIYGLQDYSILKSVVTEIRK